MWVEYTRRIEEKGFMGVTEKGRLQNDATKKKLDGEVVM